MTWWSEFSLARPRSARVSCFLVFSFGAARLAASSSCSLLNNHWSLCTPKAHIYLKVILVQLNSWESRLLVAPIGCYFDKLTAVGTTLNCARRHDFLTFPSHCYCHTYLFITKSALRLTKMSVIWREESLFVGRRVVVGGAIAVIWASETNFVWNYLSETIENHLKLFENVWNYFVWKYFVWK